MWLKQHAKCHALRQGGRGGKNQKNGGWTSRSTVRLRLDIDQRREKCGTHTESEL